MKQSEPVATIRFDRLHDVGVLTDGSIHVCSCQFETPQRSPIPRTPRGECSALIDSPAKKKPDRSLKSNRPGKKQGRLAQSPAGKLQVRKKTHSSRGVNTYRNFANDPMLLLPLSSPACNWLLFSVGGLLRLDFAQGTMRVLNAINLPRKVPAPLHRHTHAGLLVVSSLPIDWIKKLRLL